MACIEIKSYNEFLGQAVRKILACSPVNDINVGSALFTILEAAAANDYENSTMILNVLELLNIDATRNKDLDSTGSNLGLDRASAVKASGFITVTDSAITKRSTTLFPAKPAPIAGTKTLFVSCASAFGVTGNVYIGRGTENFEGPVAYSSITDNCTFFAINLTTAIQKDHLLSEKVIDAQGTVDRQIVAGTVVKIAANNISPEVTFQTLNDATLASGECNVSGVAVIAEEPGVCGNAGINTITIFCSLPFATATVTNTSKFTNGADIETDEDFRERIKSFSDSLARGTASAILSEIIGVSDVCESKQIQSAVITEPAITGDPSIIYIDDGQGFEPSFSGQSVDSLVKTAIGDEEFFQLANFPLPRAQVINTAEAPYLFTTCFVLTVEVDGVQEAVTFVTADFCSISTATLPEVVTKINDNACTFAARLHACSTRLLLYPLCSKAETIKIIDDNSTLCANGKLKFPVNEFSAITLFKNNVRLKEVEKAANLTTNAFSTWCIVATGNLIVEVDNTPLQDQTFTTSDFCGCAIASATLAQWVTAFNARYAGITAVATSTCALLLSSNKKGATSALEILGGTLIDNFFSGTDTCATGQTSSFSLNRQTGNIQICCVAACDEISAGSEDTKGNIKSLQATSSGTFKIDKDSNCRPSDIIIVNDSSSVKVRTVSLADGNTITLTDVSIAEISSVTTDTEANTAAAGYFTLNSAENATRYYVWMDTTGADMDPAPTGLTGIRVCINGDCCACTVATTLACRINTAAGPCFCAMAAAAVVTITNDVVGAATDIAMVTLVNAWAASTTTQGVSNTTRIMASTICAFYCLQPNDFVYIANRGDCNSCGTWVACASSGLYKITAKGEHCTAATDTYIEVQNENQDIGGPYTVVDSTDVQAFSADAYPQLWTGCADVCTPINAAIQCIVDSINCKIDGVIASICKTNFVKLTSTTEECGSIAIPIAIGNGTALFASGSTRQAGEQSHRANRKTGSDTLATFKRTAPANTNIWLDRYTYTDEKGTITLNEEPNAVCATYEETLTDHTGIGTKADNCTAIAFITGANKGHYRHIKTLIDNCNVGTRQDTPRTRFDHNIDEEYQVVEHLQFSDQDNIVVILDDDAINQTLTIPFSRTGRINGGSQCAIQLPINSAFSADDADNEPCVDFGCLITWGQLATQTDTNFNDYKVWFRARNFYVTGGADTCGAALIVRANEFGPVGDCYRFSIEYPTVACACVMISHSNTPCNTLETYTFGSGTARSITLTAGDAIVIECICASCSDFRYTFPNTVDFSAVVIGDVIHIDASSGVSAANAGTFSVRAVNDNICCVCALGKYIDVYNPCGNECAGNAAVQTVTVDAAECACNFSADYFILFAPCKDSIKFWYDLCGCVEPAQCTTTRSLKICICCCDTACAIATATELIIEGDAAFTSCAAGAVITVTNVLNGPITAGCDTNACVTVVTTTVGLSEVISTITGVLVFPLTDTATACIACTISTCSDILDVISVAAGCGITLATREERYTICCCCLHCDRLAFDHNPCPCGTAFCHITLKDSKSWVLTFQNANPNFTLKCALVLECVAPCIYKANTVKTKFGSCDTGEEFKLVPLNIDNIKHQIRHKALSQADLIADIDIVDNNKKIQLKSEKLGSGGAVEVVGGRANCASFSIIGDTEITACCGTNYLEVTVAAAPVTLTTGDYVKLENPSGVERNARHAAADFIDVVSVGCNNFEYRYNPKDLNFNRGVTIAITEVSACHCKVACTIWRWTHNTAGQELTFTDVQDGAIVTQPTCRRADGTVCLATNLCIVVCDAGTACCVTSTHKFKIIMSGQPVQADFFTFQNSDCPADDFAVWFDINANGTAPSHASFCCATNQIEVDILDTDNVNQIMAKVLTAVVCDACTITGSFTASLSAGASFAAAAIGDVLIAYDSCSHVICGWDNTNMVIDGGNSIFGGYTVIDVCACCCYIDVVNSDGVSMTATLISTTGNVQVSPTPIVKWNLDHAANITITSIAVCMVTATATTTQPHRLNVCDMFCIFDHNSTADPCACPCVGIVATVTDNFIFTYAIACTACNCLTPGGFLRAASKSRTRYKIESLGHNNLYRLKHVDGNNPRFINNGAAVDDILKISGCTFNSVNSGDFRILGVDCTSIIYENANAIEELDTFVKFNNIGTAVTWTTNSVTVTGNAGEFTNLAVGDWVKKTTDADTLYRQVSAFSTGCAATAVNITLGKVYTGSTSVTAGHALDQNTDIGQGVFLDNVEDVQILEGDAVRANDSLFISTTISCCWFDPTNDGTFNVDAIGTNVCNFLIFLRVCNASGTAETCISLGVTNSKLAITEGANSKFCTTLQVHRTAINDDCSCQRTVYLLPGNRVDKWSQTNNSTIKAVGKLGFCKDIVTGIDGYKYYTGLLRQVQRIVDGFEPDETTFPGRKAIGGVIELLPPLISRVTIALDITTNEGVNLSEITDEIVSTVVNGIENLGVGDDVILSAIIVQVMKITGVAAVTFTTPLPSVERISIADNEKAFVETQDVSIS